MESTFDIEAHVVVAGRDIPVAQALEAIGRDPKCATAADIAAALNAWPHGTCAYFEVTPDGAIRQHHFESRSQITLASSK